MEIWHAVLYGFVEGITEFLPISSTGHLMLTTLLLGGEHTAFIKSFEVMIQLGAILAIVYLYPKRLITDRATMLRVGCAFVPTAILGLLFYKIIKTYLLESIPLVLASLLIGGFVILFIERHLKSRAILGTRTVTDLTLRQSATLGALQCIAFIPGVSRSATTIFGGMFLGLSRKEAVEFSFFLAIPTMGAATMLDLFKSYDAFTVDSASFLAVGFITSFLVALISVRWLVRYVGQNDFTLFGFYRIAIGALGLLIFFF